MSKPTPAAVLDGNQQAQTDSSRQGMLLSVASGLEFGAEVATRQTTAQLWLTQFGGDTVAVALRLSNVRAACAVVSFLVTPLLGGLSDTLGRKPIMLFSQGVLLSAISVVLIFHRPGRGGGNHRCPFSPSVSCCCHLHCCGCGPSQVCCVCSRRRRAVQRLRCYQVETRATEPTTPLPRSGRWPQAAAGRRRWWRSSSWWC